MTIADDTARRMLDFILLTEICLPATVCVDMEWMRDNIGRRAYCHPAQYFHPGQFGAGPNAGAWAVDAMYSGLDYYAYWFKRPDDAVKFVVMYGGGALKNHPDRIAQLTLCLER